MHVLLCSRLVFVQGVAMSKAWGTCEGCGEWTLHFIRTIKWSTENTRPVIVPLQKWDPTASSQKIRWEPGLRIKTRRMLRECRECELQWWETIERHEEAI